MDEKFCSKCRTSKTLSCFSLDKNRKDGLRPECRDCCNERQRSKYRTPRGLLSTLYNSQRASSRKRGMDYPEYTRSELIDWAMSQPHFIELYDKWVDSGYVNDMSPSIDRIDDYKGYCFDNIRLVSFLENRKSYYSDVKDGLNTKVCKSVMQLSKDGDIINIFHSLMDAERNTGIKHQHISRCCLGTRKSTGGYRWKYKD